MSDTADNIDMYLESNRLRTFETWPNPNIAPASLAKAGFYYLNRLDEVKCAWCKGVVAKWEEQDNPWNEHKRFFPDCPRVQLGPLIEMTSDGIRELGIHQISPPKKPKFSSLDARLRTYSSWPISDIQEPEKLAQAGLYYQNVDDQVRCFHCSIGLRSWQKEDDPWFEHAKWCPDCQFVRLVKGSSYVQSVQSTVTQSAQAHSLDSNLSIDEAMNSTPVRQALEMGIDENSIRNVTRNQLLNKGRMYGTIEELLKAVFDDQETESSNVEGARSSLCTRFVVDESAPRTQNCVMNIAEVNSSGIQPNITSPCPIAIESSSSSSCCGSNLLQTENPAEEHRTPLESATECDLPVDIDKTLKNNIENTGENAIGLAQSAQPNLTVCKRLSLEEENRHLKDARLCKICLDEEVGVVFLPCGHLVTCVQCANGVTHCPMCRTSIRGFVRTYLS